VDLSQNEISDVSSLGNLTHLRTLNVSRNRLTRFLDLGKETVPLTNDLKLPRALLEVDYSDNELSNLGRNLGRHRYVRAINVSRNQITTIGGLYKLPALQFFDGSENLIEDVSVLNNPRLSFVFLQNNNISRLDNLKYLPALRFMDVSGNQLTSLTGLEKQKLLTALRIGNNKVADVEEVRKLALLDQLRELDLSGNPIQNTPD
jgi:internalin A